MKLVIIRHGEPDYEHDSLTEKGRREAEFLAERLVKTPADYYYVSPLGRARATAAPTLERLGREEVVLPWLREFAARVVRPDDDDIPWDLMPGYWTKEPRYYDRDHWYDTAIMRSGDVKGEYLRVTGELDGLLAKHGYVRNGGYYRAVCPNTDTIVLFCHFAVETVFISHLMGVSPVPLWHGTCAQASSVTTLVTEEREEGIAFFRMLNFGDVSHLTENGEEPSFMARFCEVYTDFSQQH